MIGPERFYDIDKELLISLSDLIGISLSKIQIYDDLRAHSVAVLLNLTGNSIRYTMPGGIVEIRVEEDDKMVYTHVKDTGIGIPQDSLDAIFSEFYTVTQTRASLARESGNSEVEKEILGAEGTGLGLSIAKAIVERHGGVIRVKSKVGIGSEFIVALQRRGGDS